MENATFSLIGRRKYPMAELNPARQKVVGAILGQKAEYVEIVDGDGKSLTLLLADEICLEEETGLQTAEEARRPLS